MNYGAIILSAGQGTRFGQKKQFFELDGKPLWKIVYDKTVSIVPIKNTVVVGVDLLGGKTRSESVRIGLNALPDEIDRVIILEAARPLVTLEQIKSLLFSTSASTTFVMPLVNTIICRNGEYLNRNELYELLTPQAFDFSLLKRAYSTLHEPDYTDETRIMYEIYNITPEFIETTPNLLKVTYKRDIYVINEMMKEETFL